MTQTRIVLGPSSQIVGDLLASILDGEPDLRIVARVRDAPAIEAAVRAHDADAVVLALPEHAGMPHVRSLLEAHPRLRVVLLAPDGRSARVVELRPHETRLHDIAPRSLAAALRAPYPSPWPGM